MRHVYKLNRSDYCLLTFPFFAKVVFMLKVSFIERSDSILKSKLGDRDDTFCWEIASLLELLCAISLISKHVKSDTALLTTVLCEH